MPLRTVFVIQLNGFSTSKKFDHYPSEDEIEEVILELFPNRKLYDQFADDYIYPEAQVKKYYMLNDKESI